MIRLDAATVLLQWATGGLLFLWVTTRHREVGLGYGWTTRLVFLLFALGAFACGLLDPEPLREAASLAVAAATSLALVVSVARKGAGVSGQRAEHDRRSARVVAMTGIDRSVAVEAPRGGREFPPALDLVAPVFGAVSDAMLLGHWYLVQPGLPRRLLNELVSWVIWMWPVEVALLLIPTGMVSVLNGSIDDGWDGILGWMWVACAVTTIVLAFVTRAALKERYYSAVMAATGLLYLAILTAFGTDLVARAVLAG